MRVLILMLKLAALGSIPPALLSAYPGVLNDFAFIAILFFPIWIPAVWFVGWMIFLKNARGVPKAAKPGLLANGEIGGGKSSVSHRRWFIVSIAILIVTFVLILNGIPRKVAFVLVTASVPTARSYGTDHRIRWRGCRTPFRRLLRGSLRRRSPRWSLLPHPCGGGRDRA